jgi:hypothetical protein
MVHRSKSMTYTWSLALYVVFLIVLSAPYWVNGYVVAPYSVMPSTELGVPIDNLPKQSKFSDYYVAFIPEIHENLNGPRAGLLKYWTSKTELGRPLFHSAGFSPAFLPSFVLSLITHDAAVFITLLSGMTVALFGLFMLLLCREWGFHPVAGLIGAIGAASLPSMMFVLYSPVYSSSFCWGFGILYGITRMQNRKDLWSMGILAFMIHALFMTAYPQTIIYICYILFGYVVIRVIENRVQNGYFDVREIGLFAGAAMIGLVSASPLYLDWYAMSNESARGNADFSFFKGIAAQPQNLVQSLRFVGQLSNPEVYGNFTNPSNPYFHWNSALPSWLAMFAYIGIFGVWKRSRYWVLIIVLLLVMNVSPTVFRFAFDYMGFNLSRYSPYEILKIPYLVCALYGLDFLITRDNRRTLIWPLFFATCVVGVQLAATVYVGFLREFPVYWSMVALSCGSILLILVQYRRISLRALLVACFLSMYFISYPLMLRFPLAATVLDSELIRTIKSNSTDTTVLALVPGNLPVVSTNYNMRLDIATIHSIDSVSPFRYKTLVDSLGGTQTVFGRNSYSINPKLDSHMLWMTNVEILVSNQMIDSPLVEYIAKVRQPGGKLTIWLYRLRNRMGKFMQIATPLSQQDASQMSFSDPRTMEPVFPKKIEDVSDRLIIENALPEDNVLVVAQKFHHAWRAEVRIGDVWRDAQTAEVNGVFLGVHVPGGASQVRLTFLPNVRWFAYIMPAWGVFWLAFLLMQMRSKWLRFR